MTLQIPMGVNSVMLRNTGTYASPTWSACTSVRNLKYDRDFGKVEVGARKHGANKVYKKSRTDFTLDFDLLITHDDASSGDLPADVDAILTAAAAGSSIDILILDGPIATDGNRGHRAHMLFEKTSEDQGLDNEVKLSITACYADFASGEGPAEYTVAS